MALHLPEEKGQVSRLKTVLKTKEEKDKIQCALRQKGQPQEQPRTLFEASVRELGAEVV